VAGLLLAIILVGGVVTTSPASALRWLEWVAADPLRFAAVLMAVAVIRPFLAWPSTLLPVATGYGYGWQWGILAGAFLITITALPPYSLAEQASMGWVRNTGRRVIDETGGTRAVLGSRLLPLPSDAISVAAGVSGVSLRPFLLGTVTGELPWVVLGVTIGVSVDRLSVGDLSVVDPAVIGLMAASGVLVLAGPVYRLVGRG
jgi:Uncharacterized conserved protein